MSSQTFDLGMYIDKEVRVKLYGGREVSGILKGYDKYSNLVLDQTVETFSNEEDGPSESRTLGVTVCHGTTVQVIAPALGYEEIENPFIAKEEAAI
mmetsp:Transcript_19514/g.35194  ORF Transcript_19514/g.35194 Transcript_19514/m.35194 type:complete len:96 (-) Transcript_19514:211-498(-)|eukprot:CAMPEP_0175045546 /NCGR_PEP_ID=MMETSP0052_2-20121109/4491_1 /TAXON_ID=51329 ORGANISM="Polytomella parva, Strain SAG 63-3" /NCGR_SAMPLE_ID=MMETSP0052_2 /ASSEMBLY_ACC=CAM_ASM_000194 /LENGTH=95 /DNA_ID=CAMNT_0016309105 /DNA_START=31 /DNA_END=318 /DNA_ORIENTATION=+